MRITSAVLFLLLMYIHWTSGLAANTARNREADLGENKHDCRPGWLPLALGCFLLFATWLANCILLGGILQTLTSPHVVPVSYYFVGSQAIAALLHATLNLPPGLVTLLFDFYSSALAVVFSFGDSIKLLGGEHQARGKIITIGDAELTMSISAEQLMSILQQQQAQLGAAHLKLIKSIMQPFRLHFSDPESSGKQSTSADAVAACIIEFIYDPDSGVTFDSWVKRCKDIFRVEFVRYFRREVLTVQYPIPASQTGGEPDRRFI
ncbi:unnamed protein product [Schistocephalus solidus]|uniref:Uncharacterized protein n=1 Tax=Schistocephalus solidus TaxID=70667 RepID=A0A183SEZ0_SCHSO|nr:unnamed protein product [Schistocephalus solidus]